MTTEPICVFCGRTKAQAAAEPTSCCDGNDPEPKARRTYERVQGCTYPYGDEGEDERERREQRT